MELLMRTTLPMLLLVSWAAAFANELSALSAYRSVQRHSLTRRNLYKSVQAAIEEAQQICASQGQGSEACRVAWDIVEELEAADSDKNRILVQADTTPDYVALLGGFDILVQKIDGKMEQLKATTSKFHELGASDPAIGLEDLYRRADEMQQALAHVQRSLRQ